MSRVSVNQIRKEVQITTSRSGGPGGQHVNKVETKVTLRWNVTTSEVLTDLEKELVRAANSTKITNDGDIIISVDTKRSQLRNKEIAFKKLDRLLARAFTKKKTRIPTQPTKAAKQKRLSNKRMHSEKKEMRKRII